MSVLKNIPNEPNARREWIKFILRSKGISLASIAREYNQSRQSVSLALYRSNRYWEEIIAEKVGAPVDLLWPERYSVTSTPALTEREEV